MPPGEGLNVGACWQCGKYTEERYHIGWRVQFAPFCGYAHASIWRKQQKMQRVKIQRAPRR